MEWTLSDLALPAALAGAVLLALVGLGCLIFCRGTNRRHLAWTACVFVPVFLLFVGGNLLLGLFGLTWRNLPSGLFCAVLLISGALGILFILGCFLPLEMPEVAPVLRWAVKGMALLSAGLVLCCALFYGPLLAVFAFGGEERVLGYRGQTLLEVENGFMDPIYDYYEYHGPLVRGAELVYARQYTPLDGNG